MIRLTLNNLGGPVRDSVEQDIAAVRALCSRDGVSLPEISLRVLACTLPMYGIDAPVHSVQQPTAVPPASFKERCEWERQRQSFQLIREGDAVWVIAGDESGAIYGVQEVLRCLTGVIWAGCDSRQHILGPMSPLPENVQWPLVPLRGRNGGATDLCEQQNYIRWLSRNRWNVLRLSSAQWMEQSIEYRQQIMKWCEARCIQLGLGDHSIHYFITQEDYEQHPEWRGMRDGKRVTHAHVVVPEAQHLNAELPVQPCFSNDQLVETLTDRIAKHMGMFPSIDLFAMWSHDGVNNWCQCESCRSSTPYELIHRLVVLLERKLPQRTMIETIAYSNLLNLPRQSLSSVERTFALFCPYLRHYFHAIYDAGGPEETSVGVRYPEPDRINPVDEREYGPLFERWVHIWKQAGIVPGIFEYSGNFYDETFRTNRTRYFYHPSAQCIGEEIDWYVEHGVQVYYFCGAVRAWPDAFHELALAAALWGGGETVMSLAEVYYTAVAGEKSSDLRQALSDISKSLDFEKTPTDEFQTLEQLLPMIPNQVQRFLYQRWIDYIKLVRVSCEELASQDFVAVIQKEQHVIDWIDEHHHEIGWAGRISRLRSLASINQQRMTERVNKQDASQYVL